MENYYNIDSLEQFLKDSLTDFKMQPKKRVWKSIYNNIHPSKKMPSAFTSLIILISIFSLGINNTVERNTISTNIITTSLKPTTNSINSKEIVLINKIKPIEHSTLMPRLKNKIILLSTLMIANKNQSLKHKIDQNLKSSQMNAAPILLNATVNNIDLYSSLITDKKEISNRPTYKITNDNLNRLFSYELYAAPSIWSRNLGNNGGENGLNNLNQNDKNHSYSYSNNLNFEAGGAVLLNVTKAFRIKAGMQLNYSKYKLKDNNLDNLSTAKSNLLSSSDMGKTMSLGDDNAINYSSYQISFPIGTEFEIAGNNWLHWFAGAAIEPTYRLGDFSTIDDHNNAFNQSDKRKWNINTSVETFLSLKISNGAYLNAGPQLKYQLLSNYDKTYNYNEKFYNIGLKLGISRNF